MITVEQTSTVNQHRQQGVTFQWKEDRRKERRPTPQRSPAGDLDSRVGLPLPRAPIICGLHEPASLRYERNLGPGP